MDGDDMNEQKILTPELLEKELNVLVEKKVISQRIAEKIKHKIQKEKLIINQTDLTPLSKKFSNLHLEDESRHLFFSRR